MTGKGGNHLKTEARSKVCIMTKTSAMDRLAKYSKIPTKIAAQPVSTQIYDQDVRKPVENINASMANQKPQRRATVESPDPPTLSQIMSSISTTVLNSHTKKSNVADANNNTKAGLHSSIKKSAPSRRDSGTIPVAVLEMDESASPKKVESLKDKVSKCICHRPKTHILCTICGYSNYGNVRMPCYAHHRVAYLLDLTCCPRCNSGRLMEVTPPSQTH